MTAFDHVYKHGNNRYLAIHLGNQDTTLVVADRWIIAHPDADRSRARRPDLLIAFNVDPAAYHASNGYIVSEQGKPPDFVLEVASESTGATDTGAKRQDYAALGISEYWRFDETGQHHGVRLAGDQLVGDRYRPITIEQLPDGTLQGYSPALNLFLHWQDGQLLWIDPATQQPSSPTRTSYPAPNRPLPAPSRPLPASANSRTKSAASGDNNPEHRIRLDSWRRWSTSDPKVADLGANSATCTPTNGCGGHTQSTIAAPQNHSIRNRGHPSEEHDVRVINLIGERETDIRSSSERLQQSRNRN